MLAASGVTPETRGHGAHARTINPILMGDEQAESLLVCEVYTPPGHWSSYPPHKHDRDAMPEESFLEETYYFRIDPPQGFGLQRVYTDDRSLDETLSVRDRDTVLVPRGYHTVSAPPGYAVYYLNVMAGPTRAWAVANDPDHEWTLRAMTAPTATRLLDNYVAGAWTPAASGAEALDVTNPATGRGARARAALHGGRPRRRRRRRRAPRCPSGARSA